VKSSVDNDGEFELDALGRSEPVVEGSRITVAICVTTLGKLFTPMCLCHQVITGQRTVTFFGWEGDRRPGEK